jgi:hypothetical protein
MVRVRSPAGLQDADIAVTVDFAVNGKTGTALGRYAEKRNGGTAANDSAAKPLVDTALAKPLHPQEEGAKTSPGHYKRASALAFGASPPFVAAGLTASLAAIAVSPVDALIGLKTHFADGPKRSTSSFQSVMILAFVLRAL